MAEKRQSDWCPGDDPFDPDADLDRPPAPESGVHSLSPRLEQLLDENRAALRAAPAPTLRTPRRLRDRLADRLEDFGCGFARGWWSALRLLRGA